MFGQVPGVTFWHAEVVTGNWNFYPVSDQPNTWTNYCKDMEQYGNGHVMTREILHACWSKSKHCNIACCC